MTLGRLVEQLPLAPPAAAGATVVVGNLPSLSRPWLPSADKEERPDLRHPLLLDIIGACLQPRPTARPSVAALLGSPFFSLDVGAILTAKKFSPSDPNLVITAFGSKGQKLTAASKDNKFGIWQGTFIVP